MNSSICVLAGNSNRPLTESICRILGVGLGLGDVKHFSDGETSVDIHESIRGKDIFIVQSTCSPTNEHLMELLVMLDATKRASAKGSRPSSPTSVMPGRTERPHPGHRLLQSLLPIC